MVDATISDNLLFVPISPPSSLGENERNGQNNSKCIENHVDGGDSGSEKSDDEGTAAPKSTSQKKRPVRSAFTVPNTESAAKEKAVKSAPAIQKEHAAPTEMAEMKGREGATPSTKKKDESVTSTATINAPKKERPEISSTAIATLTSQKSYIVSDSGESINQHELFSTPIFDIFVSRSKHQFMVHEGVLVQSPLLARLVEACQTKRKGQAQKTMELAEESPENFGLLLNYLYSHQLTVPSASDTASPSSDAIHAAKTLAKLYVLASKYELDSMQQRVTLLLHKSGLFETIPGLQFFELAETLYPEDRDDAAADAFAQHFERVAPGLIRSVPDHDLPHLLRMVSNGGAFAEAIFKAYNQAVRSGYGALSTEHAQEAEETTMAGFPACKRARIEVIE